MNYKSLKGAITGFNFASVSPYRHAPFLTITVSFSGTAAPRPFRTSFVQPATSVLVTTAYVILLHETLLCRGIGCRFIYFTEF